MQQRNKEASNKQKSNNPDPTEKVELHTVENPWKPGMKKTETFISQEEADIIVIHT